MKITQRSYEKESIDLGQYTQKDYHDCLKQLDRIGHYLGGDQANFWAFKQLKCTPQSILEVGCGGGLFLQKLAKQFPSSQFLGIDISEEAITFAQTQNDQANVNFKVCSPELDYPPNAFDILLSTLVCHHLTDEQLIDFLKKSYSIAEHAIIINDLHRSPLATIGFALLTPLLFRNKLVLHDGLISIRRAFIKKDWIALLKAADIPIEQCSITWHWAFRWIVIIQKIK